MLSTLIFFAASTPSLPAPEKFLASSERWTYTGTIRVYNSFADAVSERNPRTPEIQVPRRDGAIYIARNMGGEFGEFNAILTNWYASPDPNKKGHNNPNNKNEGFVQMYDADASNWQEQKAYWNRDKTAFTVEAKGKRASYPSVQNPGDYARLWNAGSPPGAGEATKGTFLRYEYRFTATGLTAQDLDNDGIFENVGNATGYAGAFTAIFQNESVRYPAANGFYVVKLTFGNQSWAVSQNLAENDSFKSGVVK